MIDDKETAKEVCQSLIECRDKLTKTLDLVKKNCSDEEIIVFKKTLGKIIGYMMLGIRDPIYIKHPDLVPTDLKDIYSKEKED